MIWNLITFLGCLGMLLVFRRMDRANLKMTKLRRYSSKMFDDYRKLAETEKRKFQDATIEMDILIKKSNSLAKNISGSLKEIDDRLKGLDAEKTSLKKVEEDIRVISGAARDVNRQIEYIASAQENFTEFSNRINGITDRISELRNENMSLLQNFETKLRERSRELLDDFNSSSSRAVTEMEKRVSDSGVIILDTFKVEMESVARNLSGANNLEQQIENLRSTLSNLENSVFGDIKTKSIELKNEITGSFESFKTEKHALFEKLDVDIEKIYGKLRYVETNVDESKDKLIKTFQGEVDRIRTEVDGLSIHSISKKDEIVQAARKEAEETRRKIEEFEEKYTSLERRIINTAEEKIENLEVQFKSLEGRFSGLQDTLKNSEVEIGDSIAAYLDRVRKDFSSMDSRLGDIKNEILSYEENNRIFSRTDQMMQKVDEAIRQYNAVVATAQIETKRMEEFVAGFDQLKEIRKSVEREINTYKARREKMGDVENVLRGLMELSDLAMNRATEVQDALSRVDLVNGRIDALSETYSTVESRIDEMHEHERAITKSLESVNRTDILIQAIDNKVKAFQKLMERSEKKIEKVNQQLKDIDENTMILSTRKNEIQELKDKFDEIDSLSDMMQKRVDQIYAMFKKTETLRQEIDSTDGKLQQMFHETDKKMRELADFIQAVDKNNPILKQVKGETPASPAKNLNENIIRTVRDLSSKGWEPADISKKLMIDENSIRFIINTTSL